MFTAAGAAVGSEMLVNTATENEQGRPQITALSNGGFVVTWIDSSHGVGGATGDTSNGAIKAQVFTGSGAAAGGEILINTATASDQDAPQISALVDGGFVVTWNDRSHGVGGATGDTSSYAVKAQIFTAAGAAVGSEVLVNTATEGSQGNPQITALANGGFVVTWIDSSLGIGGATGDTSGSAVKAQSFTASGAAAGGEILVNTATASDQQDPQITALANDGFVVTWFDFSHGVGGATGDTSGTAVKAQVFAPLATPGPVLSIEAASADKPEGNSGTTDFTFTVTRTGDASDASIVHWAVGANQDPSADLSDFTGATSGDLTFTPGDTNPQTITVHVVGDTIHEGGGFPEHFTIDLSNANGATIDPLRTSANGNIQNDDAQGAGITWDIAFDDSTGNYAPYYSDIERVLRVAGDHWSSYLGGTASIQISVLFDPELGAHAGSRPALVDVTSTLVVSVVANEIKTGSDSNGAVADLELIINPRFIAGASDQDALSGLFWFDPNPASGGSSVPDGMRDALSTFEHELGHSLGIYGFLPDPAPTTETPFDQFVEFDGSYYFTGPNAEASNGGPVALESNHPGSDVYYLDIGSDTMYYTRPEGQAGRKPISALDLAILNDTGIPIAHGTSGNDVLSCVSGQNSIDGGEGNDTLKGGIGGDTLVGGTGADMLSGAAGGDTLVGGLGKDVLIGGTDADIIKFNLKTESAKGANRDVISDFSGVTGGELDHIDVRGIDANATRAGNQNFKFISAQAFHHKAGELHFIRKAGGHLFVEGDINGDGKADFQIDVHNLANDLHSLAKADFIL